MNNLCEKKKIYDKNLELLSKYREGDKAAGEILAEQNMPLVYSIASRFSGRGADMSDLVESGNIGLVKAMKTFDFSHGTAFSTYAVPLIVGEIRRHLRDDGPVKVSRIYKRQGMMIMREKNRIATEEGRDAGIAELAERCGMSAEEAAISLDAISPVTSLSDYVFGEDSVTYESVIPDEESELERERLCDRISLSQCIDRLPPLWRQLLLLRYYKGMTQQATAEALGLTQVKVSREEKKILSLLRKELS